MLHLAAYIMAPFIGMAMAAPAPQASAVPLHGTNSSSLQGGSQSPSNVNNYNLITQLQNAATATDRIKLLPNNLDHAYDFLNPPSTAITSGKGGHTVRAARNDFPALVGTGVSMTLGFIGPCGFNTPHTHPRSSEINVIVQGRLGTNFITENGAPAIGNLLSQYQMTVFPQGAIHTEFNPDCTDAVFVAGFASEDPGVLQIAQRIFDLQDDVIQAEFGNDFTFDGADIDTFRSMIPANVATGVESCLKKCGIQKRSAVPLKR